MRTCQNCGHSLRDDDRFCSSCGTPADALRPPLLAAEDGAAPRRGDAGFLRAARRFWWVLLIGVLLASFMALSTFYRVTYDPPGLESRDVVTYSSSARLLVTSDGSSHFRSQTTIFGDPPEGQEGQDQPPIVGVVATPDAGQLIRSANLFPLLIESDEVAEFRANRYGDVPGTITARGIYSISTANRFELSQIPVIQLEALAATPEDAVALADTTASAFIDWVERQQRRSGIPERDRIVVEQLNEPTAAAIVSGSSKVMPVLVFGAILAAFSVLILLLDRLIPPRRKRPESSAEPSVEPLEKRPVKVKKTA